MVEVLGLGPIWKQYGGGKSSSRRDGNPSGRTEAVGGNPRGVGRSPTTPEPQGQEQQDNETDPAQHTPVHSQEWHAAPMRGGSGVPLLRDHSRPLAWASVQGAMGDHGRPAALRLVTYSTRGASLMLPLLRAPLHVRKDAHRHWVPDCPPRASPGHGPRERARVAMDNGTRFLARAASRRFPPAGPARAETARGPFVMVSSMRHSLASFL